VETSIDELARNEDALEIAAVALRAQLDAMLVNADADSTSLFGLLHGRRAHTVSRHNVRVLTPGLFVPLQRESRGLSAQLGGGAGAAVRAQLFYEMCVAALSDIVDACERFATMSSSSSSSTTSSAARVDIDVSCVALWVNDASETSARAPLDVLLTWQSALVRAVLVPASVRLCERVGGWLLAQQASERGDAGALAALRSSMTRRLLMGVDETSAASVLHVRTSMSTDAVDDLVTQIGVLLARDDAQQALLERGAWASVRADDAALAVTARRALLLGVTWRADGALRATRAANAITVASGDADVGGTAATSADGARTRVSHVNRTHTISDIRVDALLSRRADLRRQLADAAQRLAQGASTAIAGTLSRVVAS
jgi:hypothetical protein